MTTIHILIHGSPACKFVPDFPDDVPPGNYWVSLHQVADVERSEDKALLCPECLAAAKPDTMHISHADPMPPVLCLWTIYDHPKDYPNAIVARKYDVNANGTTATGDVRLFANVELARQLMQEMGLTRIPRDPSDDPVIVETWL